MSEHCEQCDADIEDIGKCEHLIIADCFRHRDGHMVKRYRRCKRVYDLHVGADGKKYCWQHIKEHMV